MSEFDTNLLRVIAAELHLSNGLHVAREMFGKSYFALGVSEKVAVDQAANAMLAGNFQMMSAEYLKGQTARAPVGFQTEKPNS